MIQSSSPGNLFLFGEHAVVYKKPAIIVSVGKRVKCQAKTMSLGKIEIDSREFGKASFCKKKRGNKDLFILLDLCKDFLSKFKIKKGIRLKIISDIPVASGMSSSSAVLCSILCSLSKLFGLGIHKRDYYKYLIGYQRVIHGGRASGAEIISSSEGGFSYISFNQDLKIEKLGSFPFEVVIGDTGIKTKTSRTVKFHIPNLMREKPDFVKRCFTKIEKITKKGLKAILERDLTEIGRLMSKNQKILSELGLSHPKLDVAIKKALEAGAYGAKLSGKGQGGVMLALVDRKSRGRVAKAIKEAGLEVIQTRIGVKGVK